MLAHYERGRRRALGVVGAGFPPIQRAALDGAFRPRHLRHAHLRFACTLCSQYLPEFQAFVQQVPGHAFSF